MGTPDLALYDRADTLAHTLSMDVVNTLLPDGTKTPPWNWDSLSPMRRAQVANDVGQAEAQAFKADFDLSLTAQPQIDQIADADVKTLETNLQKLVQSSDPPAQAQYAQGQFVQDMFGPHGLFGPQGPLSFKAPVNPFDNPQHIVYPSNKMPPDDTPSGIDYYRMYTFTNANVKEEMLNMDTTYYRVISDPEKPPVPENNYYGSYLSTQQFFNSQDAIRGLRSIRAGITRTLLR